MQLNRETRIDSHLHDQLISNRDPKQLNGERKLFSISGVGTTGCASGDKIEFLLCTMDKINSRWSYY
jgi:hypothetical protein